MPAPAVTITIVLYNSADALGACLGSLRADVESGLAELLVVDNASPDASAAIVARELPGTVLIRSPSNLGFARGCNSAWARARGRYWLLLNPDVVLPAGALGELVGWMDARPGLGVGSPAFLDAAGRATTAARRFPSIALALLELSRLHLLLPRALRGRVLLGPYWDGGGEVEADWVPATALLARREAVEAAGLLPERFFMYGEDVEWCWRIKRAGWSVSVNGRVRAVHGESTSATRTWGPDEARRRRVRGWHLASRVIRGPAYAWAHAAVSALALAVEALHPGRSGEARRRARQDLRLHAELLLGR
jgi:hypothetical protein